MKVLITGGNGKLGRPLVRMLAEAGHTVRIMSRQPRPEHGLSSDVEWTQADLISGTGLRAAVESVDAIIHAASDPYRSRRVDVEGTRALVEASRSTDLSHFIYISIVGIDDFPYKYYQCKREAEQIIQSSGLRYSILRGTQFHSLIDYILTKAALTPFLMPLPAGFKFQSVDESEVAARLTVALADGPAGRLPDFGGPSVLTLKEMAETWLEVREKRMHVIDVPVPGSLGAAFRAGRNTAPKRTDGRVSWKEWLMTCRK